MMYLKPAFIGAAGLGLRVVHFAAIGKMVIDSGAAFLGAHGHGFDHFGRRLVKGFHMGNMRHVAGEVKG